MIIDKLKELSLSELKQHYSDWLNTQNLSPNTVNTSKNDAFYVIKHNQDFDFWIMIESDNFETIAREILEKTLTTYSRGNVQANINGYLAHLRRFRKFAFSDTELLPLSNDTHKEKEYKPRRVKRTTTIPTPTSEEVLFYLEQWHTMENYRLQEEALDKLFKELSPYNSDLSDILIKTATLNDFYSTNIFSIYPVAKHILSLGIDARLMQGDASLVDDIKAVVIGDKTMNFYSFATKYCSHHNPREFPIYDSYVEEVLKYFRDVDGFTSFKNHELKDFAKFKSVLVDFCAYYKLEGYTLKQIDQYVWQLGKKYFPKNYYKKR